MEAAEGSAATAATAKPSHRRAWITLGALIAATTAYFVTFSIVGYTDDAYVWSDLVTIAPQVPGPVKTVEIQDNQPVAAGDMIAVIDPRPFQLDVDLKLARVASLEASVVVKQEAVAGNKASADAAAGALVYAQKEYDRINVLTGELATSQAALDRARDVWRTAKDRVADRLATVQVAQREVDASVTAVAVAKADLAVAQYSLSQTRIASTVDGYVNNLTLRPGDYAKAGEGVVGVVDASQWRVIANFKEDVASKLEEGHRVRIWLDSDPWHLWSGRVQGVGRGIARRPGPEQLLPYVSPTTDWIRLRRRFPVTILFDPPMPRKLLFMGADARIFLWR